MSFRFDQPEWMISTSVLIRAIAVVCLTMLLAACGGDDAEPGSPGSTPDGREIAQSAGCTSCHGAEGQGSVGPPWKGLAGSRVELEDGSTVVADTEYLRRAITDPGAEVVAGATVDMPENSLSDEEVDALVEYIQSLG